VVGANLLGLKFGFAGSAPLFLFFLILSICQFLDGGLQLVELVLDPGNSLAASLSTSAAAATAPKTNGAFCATFSGAITFSAPRARTLPIGACSIIEWYDISPFCHYAKRFS
jgi:hypothetical protein